MKLEDVMGVLYFKLRNEGEQGKKTIIIIAI